MANWVVLGSGTRVWQSLCWDMEETSSALDIFVRVMELSRWDAGFLVKLKGTPSKPNPSGVDRYGRIEECEDPHAMIEVDPEKHAQQKSDHEVHKRTRIIRADLDKYGYTDGCPCCEAMKAGNHATDKNHT